MDKCLGGESMNRDQLKELIDVVESNEQLMKVFDALESIGLENYFVGAGVIAQSVWNNISGYELDRGISDIDIVYFDEKSMSESHEQDIKQRIEEYLGEFSLWLDIKNEARVHTWYKEKFGYEIKPYTSLEDAINTWPTTATSLGLRRESNGEWSIYAPFGIEDVFDMRIRANARQITKEIYMKKVNKWTKRWPKLTYEEWNDKIEPIIYDEAIRFRNK